MSDHNEAKTPMTEMTSRIVAAYVANNTIDPGQISQLIHDTHASLTRTARGGGPAGGTAGQNPAVPIKDAVQRDRVVCLECGKALKTIKRHLSARHGLTPEGYRERWGLSAAHPLVAPNYAAKRSQLAKDLGLGRPRKS